MNNKLDFISFLRGLSCLIIMIGHLLIYFFVNTDWSTFPYIQLQVFDNKMVEIINSFLLSFSFNCGAFGVATFFLITGFVTIMSLEKDHSIIYIVKRIFRLYPTYIVGFSFTAITIFIWCKYTNYTFPFSRKDCVIHTTLFRNFFCSPYIDNGVWTLEINMDFYILMFVLFIIAGLLKKKINSQFILELSLLISAYSIFGYKVTPPNIAPVTSI